MSDVDTVGENGAPVRFVGYPDGEKLFVAELGTEVGTFTQPAGGKHKALAHHVPLSMRGFFRPDQLANYDPTREYRTDAFGYLLCHGKTASDTRCSRKAVNRWPRCSVHGGRLHPFDMLVKETGEPETEATLSRYQLYMAGQLHITEIDDDELLAFGFKDKNGRMFRPKNVPREMVTAFTEQLFERSLEKLKTSALDAANTLASLMVDTNVDANVRLKAATEILDRTVGKAPLQVQLTSAAPWEQVFESISVSRPDVIDAEVEPDPSTPQLAVRPTTDD